MNTDARNIGFNIATRGSVFPQSATAAVNGSWVDRNTPGGQIALSCQVHAMRGVTSGSPTTATLALKLQQSATGPSDGTDATDFSTAPTTLSADGTDLLLNVSLSGAQRYVRAVATPAFTGGTSPSMMIAADIVLGGVAQEPAV